MTVHLVEDSGSMGQARGVSEVIAEILPNGEGGVKWMTQ
jgi:hypothetical protein